MSEPRRRRMRFSVKSRHPEDAMRLLSELKDALDLDAFDHIDVQLDLGKSDETPHARTFGNEQVETEIHRRVDHRLETKAAELAKSNESQTATTPTCGESPERIVEKLSSLRQLGKVFRDAGYRLAPKIVYIAVKDAVKASVDFVRDQWGSTGAGPPGGG